jgi:multimeric flavodoxin WrbA
MKITLLNGNPEGGNSDFDHYLKDLENQLSESGHLVNNLTLRDLEAHYCTGCFSCWVKTPGLCIFKDDSHLVCQDVIHSDFVLFASPVLMGYLSAELKKYMDKLIPLLHPHLIEDQGEAHHQYRYAPEDYPLGGLLLEKTPGTDDEDIEIISHLQSRTMLNFKSRNAFTLLTESPVEEVADAINRL